MANPTPFSMSNSAALASFNRRRLRILGQIFLGGWLFLLIATPRYYGVGILPFALVLMPVWLPWLARKWSRKNFRWTIAAIVGLCLSFFAFVLVPASANIRREWMVGIGVWGSLWCMFSLPSLLITYYFRCDDPSLRLEVAPPPVLSNELTETP